MAQLFICYAHKDKDRCDKLVSWLKENDFADNEIWYDHHIEGGNNWRDEITTAIDESYAMLVVMTENSMESQYCTYEWAYAMGQGMTVFPLLFEQLDIQKIPAPLASRQYIDGTDEIPTTFKRQLQQLRSTPPQIDVINRQVFDIIELTHRRYFVLGWIGEGLQNIGTEYSQDILIDFIRESQKALGSMQKLILENASAFNGRQYTHCWTLIDILKKLARLQYRYENSFPNYLYQRFESEWLPAFEYFEGDGWWRKWMQKYFFWDLADHDNKLKVFAEIARIFPRMESSEINLLIENKDFRQKDDEIDTNNL